MEFITFLRLSTQHPDYAKVAPWAVVPGLIKVFSPEGTESVIEAKVHALRLIQKAGALGAYQDAFIMEASQYSPLAPLHSLLPDSPDWTFIK